MFLCMIVRIQILISMTECFFVLTFVLFVFNLMDWDNPKCVYNFTAIAIIFVLKSIFFSVQEVVRPSSLGPAS